MGLGHLHNQLVISSLVLAFLLLLLSILPAEIAAKHEPRCDRNCLSKASLTTRSAYCGQCCKYLYPHAKGSCGGGLFSTKKCMCNSPGQKPLSCLNLNLNMPSVGGAFGGGLCLRATNSERAKNGLAKLKYNSKLQAAAKKHNDYMIRTNCYEHNCPGEPGLKDRVLSSGYKFSIVAENLIAGQKVDCSVHVQRWLASPGHKANLLNRQVTELGCYQGICRKCKYRYYITCLYGAPSAIG